MEHTSVRKFKEIPNLIDLEKIRMFTKCETQADQVT